MIKLLKSEEQKRLLKARKEQERQNKIIAELEQKRLKRQAVVNAVESKYGSEMQIYRVRSQQRAIGDPALVRLMILCREHDIRKYNPQEWAGLFDSFNLGAFVDWLNTSNPPVKPPEKQTIDPLEHD